MKILVNSLRKILEETWDSSKFLQETFCIFVYSFGVSPEVDFRILPEISGILGRNFFWVFSNSRAEKQTSVDIPKRSNSWRHLWKKKSLKYLRRNSWKVFLKKSCAKNLLEDLCKKLLEETLRNYRQKRKKNKQKLSVIQKSQLFKIPDWCWKALQNDFEKVSGKRMLSNIRLYIFFINSNQYFLISPTRSSPTIVTKFSTKFPTQIGPISSKL